MANEVKITVSADTTKAQAGLRGLKDRLGDVAAKTRGTGIALSAFGAAGLIAIKGLTSAAMEQRRAMATLGATVEASGTSFDSVRDKIEETTAALERKTNFGDEAQMRALSLLVPVLGSVDMALEALPVLLDASASSGKNLETVVSTMGRALSGATNTSIILGMTFEETATFADRLAIAEGKIGGAAEANADPMIQMGNAVGSLKEVIGEQLLPIIIPLIEGFMGIVESIQTMNPNLLRVITLVAAGAVAFAAIGGPILLLLGLLPMLVTGLGMVGTAITIAMGPVGLIIIAIAALVAGGILLIANWDAIKVKAQEIFTRVGEIIVQFKDRVVEIFRNIGNVILDPFRDFARMLADLMSKMPAMIANLIPGFEAIKGGLEEFSTQSLAHGGIVRRPTMALIGEAGPEAVIPLSGGGQADAFLNRLGAQLAGAMGGGAVIVLDGRIVGQIMGDDAMLSEQTQDQ